MLEKSVATIKTLISESSLGLLDAPTPSVEALMMKHGLDRGAVMRAIKAGAEVEREHTTNDIAARAIAMDHLWERPDYYDRLKELESSPIRIG